MSEWFRRFCPGRHVYASLSLVVLLAGASPFDVAASDLSQARDVSKETSKAKVDLDQSVKPLIGINCDVQGDKPRKIGLSHLYVEAIQKAGGIAILLPPMPQSDLEKIVDKLDGVLMIGGDDYPPSIYGAEPHASVSIMHKSRSDFDIALVKAVLARNNMPFLGICAGSQALNIGAGGTLTQDIPSSYPQSKVMHASKDGWQKGFNMHEVKFAPGSKLCLALGQDSLAEPTSHHQCVEKLGAGLVPAASTADGVVEAVEMPSRSFVVGVQFHPERAFDKNQALFAKFIEAAQSYSSSQK